MNDKSIVLSISMLISGKKDMLKSLESLHYFKDAFPCEIILVDTGCNAEQRALAERYADKIFDFEWCNDFAAARNVGLKAAEGEWFLYLDDDEWFDNPKEIIEFFKSGEYKHYNCASYTVRNYSNPQGTMYDDSYPSRMVKLEPETVFVGKIHEYIEPFKLPKKEFSDFVHHYGYVYKDEEEKKKHAYRNIEPLLEMRKKHPGDPRWICQLAQEYFSIQEYEEVIRACETGLEEWSPLKDYVEYAPAHVGAIYGYILISLESMKNFEEEKKWLETALADSLAKMKIMEPTVAFYCLVGARLYSNIKDYALCRKYLKKYIEIYNRLKDNRAAIEAGSATIVAGVFQEQLLYGAILMCMESTIRMEDYALCEEAFYLLNWDDRRLLHQVTWEKNMLDALCSVEYHPLWARLLQTLVSREDGIQEMYVIFLEAEIEFKQQRESEKLLRLRRLIAQLDYEHRYILCTKILWTGQNMDFISEEERKVRVTGLFGHLFEQYPGEILEIKAGVWNVAKQLEISMEPLLCQMDYRIWKQELERWCRETSLQGMQQWDARIAAWKQHSDIRYDLFSVKCMEGYLRKWQEICLGNTEAERLEKFENLLWRYADRVVAYYELLYREFVFREVPMILPDEAQLALQLKAVRQYRKQGDDRRALENVRKCLGVYPVLESVIDAYAKMYRDEIQRRSREAEETQTELAGLIQSLKLEARMRIRSGDFQTAKEILCQIQQCAPEDEEVRNLLQKIAEQ